MKLSIIIINYKTPNLTTRCIDSIYKSGITIPFEIIVVDNCSQDNSKEQITNQFSDIKWIQNTYNAGFGRANNLGVENANGDYILLLNSDMLLLEDQALQKCIEPLSQKEIGLVGCKLINEDCSFQKSTYFDVATVRYLLSYNILWYKLFKPKPKSFDAIMGSFMLFLKKDFDDLKGFDEDFFMYAEELELCKRFKEIGKSCVYIDEYTAIHNHGGSSDGSSWSLRQNLLSNALLYFKLRGWFGYLLYHFIFHLNILTNSFLFFTLTSESRKNYLDLYKSYFSNYITYFKIPFYYTFKSKKDRVFLKVKK